MALRIKCLGDLLTSCRWNRRQHRHRIIKKKGSCNCRKTLLVLNGTFFVFDNANYINWRLTRVEPNLSIQFWFSYSWGAGRAGFSTGGWCAVWQYLLTPPPPQALFLSCWAHRATEAAWQTHWSTALQEEEEQHFLVPPLPRSSEGLCKWRGQAALSLPPCVEMSPAMDRLGWAPDRQCRWCRRPHRSRAR